MKSRIYELEQNAGRPQGGPPAGAKRDRGIRWIALLEVMTLPDDRERPECRGHRRDGG